MNQSFKSIAIIGKYMNQSALQLRQRDLLELARHLSNRNIQVWIEENTAQYAEITGYKTASLKNIGGEVELVVVMGGADIKGRML